jgi:hypothetical protein
MVMRPLLVRVAVPVSTAFLSVLVMMATDLVAMVVIVLENVDVRMGLRLMLMHAVDRLGLVLVAVSLAMRVGRFALGVLMLVMLVAVVLTLAVFVIVVLRLPVSMLMMVTLLVLILIMPMDCPFMDGEVDPFHIQPLLPLEVHVKIADIHFRQLPFEGGRFDAEVAQSADRHVAADAGETIKIEDFHGRKEWSRQGELRLARGRLKVTRIYFAHVN